MVGEQQYGGWRIPIWFLWLWLSGLRWLSCGGGWQCVGLLGKKQEVWLLLSGLRTESCGFREERERQGGT